MLLYTRPMVGVMMELYMNAASQWDCTSPYCKQTNELINYIIIDLIFNYAGLHDWSEFISGGMSAAAVVFRSEVDHVRGDHSLGPKHGADDSRLQLAAEPCIRGRLAQLILGEEIRRKTQRMENFMHGGLN